MDYKVNLPNSLGGFTFKGIHSSVFGVRQTPRERVLSPLKRRQVIEIPGRSMGVVQEDGGYNLRVETIRCSYVKQEGVLLQRQVRLIAGWLDGVGELTYDYEPEMHYTAFLSSSPPTLKMLEYAIFDLEFTCNHPFAYETPKQIVNQIFSGDSFIISPEGTVNTPVRLIIKNLGTKPITNMIISSNFIQE